VGVRADHRRRAGVERRAGERALAGVLARRALDAPVKRRDDDIGTAAGGPDRRGNCRKRRARGARAAGTGEERRRADVREAHESDLPAEAGDDLGFTRGRECGARADGPRVRAADGAHRVQQCRHAEVADVIVGEVEHVEAGEAHDRGEISGAAAEVELLWDRGPAVRDRALEVAEGDVGAPQRGRNPAPRMQGALLLHDGEHAVAEFASPNAAAPLLRDERQRTTEP